MCLLAAISHIEQTTYDVNAKVSLCLLWHIWINHRSSCTYGEDDLGTFEWYVVHILCISMCRHFPNTPPGPLSLSSTRLVRGQESALPVGPRPSALSCTEERFQLFNLPKWIG